MVEPPLPGMEEGLWFDQMINLIGVGGEDICRGCEYLLDTWQFTVKCVLKQETAFPVSSQAVSVRKRETAEPSRVELTSNDDSFPALSCVHGRRVMTRFT